MSFVLDASVALSWCLEDELHPLAVRSKELQDVARRPPGASHRAGASLGGSKPRGFRQLSLARDHGLAAYDAAYLDLALQALLPLVTLDSRLRERAGIAGVPGFGVVGDA